MDTAMVRSAAIELVQDERGVRVEDYLAALAAVVGEAALAASGFDVEHHDLAPGSGLFFAPVNDVLSGDQGTVDGAPATSVVGILRGWVPDLVSAADFPPPDELYRHVASTIGEPAWGEVALTVPDQHRPSWPPLRAAYELRDALLAAEAALGTPPSERQVLAATALLDAGREVAGAIDSVVAVRLALEVTFGMAKTAPMTRAAFESAVGDAAG